MTNKCLDYPWMLLVGGGVWREKEKMFTFSQGIFPSPGAHASAECKEADIQAVGSSTLACFDAGIQVTVNTQGMAATLERHGTCICVIVCLCL